MIGRNLTRRLGTAVGIGGLLALSIGAGSLHAQAQAATTSTTTTLTSGTNPSVAGGSVLLTAVIVPATTVPTGTVQFKDGGVNLGTAQTVSAGSPSPNGTASLTTAFMSAATHHLTAVYSGDSVNSTSTSGTVNQVVNVGPASQIAVVAAPATIVANQTGTKSTLTATVEDVGGNPVTTSGTVLTFTTSAGTLTTPTATTNGSGVATDHLTASTSTLGGTDTVTVSGAGPISGTAAVSETGTNTNFVNAAYTTMLGHLADTAGLSYWVGRLNGGTPRGTLAMALATTSEYRTNVISGNGLKTFYMLYLGRPGDAAGIAYWVSRMSGTGGTPLTFEQVRLQFIDSPEYSAVGGPNQGVTATIIKALYTEVLGRPFDQAGVDYWTAHYNVNTIGTQFLFSPEGRSYLVNNLYVQILARPADVPGGAFWTNALLGGASDENVIASILGSDEYYSTHH